LYQKCFLILKFHLLITGPTNEISTENEQSNSVYSMVMHTVMYRAASYHHCYIISVRHELVMWLHHIIIIDTLEYSWYIIPVVHSIAGVCIHAYIRVYMLVLYLECIVATLLQHHTIIMHTLV